MAIGALTRLAKYATTLIFDSGIRQDLLGNLGSQNVTYTAGDIAADKAQAQSLQIRLDGTRSLADFKGFVGDGVADDSDAYERAVLWQISKTKIWNPQFGTGFSSAVFICPGLTIPRGARIRLTRTMPTAAYLVAHGFASIEAGPNVDMIVGNASYRAHYENIYFIGGKVQVHLNNKNVNFGLWMFRNCTFVGSNGAAVKLMNTATDWGVTSTQAIFDTCRWSRCRQHLITQCDHTFMSGGWQQNAGDWFDANTAAIEHTGLFTMSDIMLVPGGDFPARSRWIDSHGGVRLIKVRFGGEGGGLPGIYWFPPPPKYVAGTDESIEVGVTFDGCSGYYGNLARVDAGALVCKGHLPRNFRYTNCTGPIARRLIHNDPADGGIPDIPAYLANLKTAWDGADMYQEFIFVVNGTGMKINSGLWPAALDTYFYTDKGRVIEPRVSLSCAGTQAGTGIAAKLDFATATVDPYGYQGQTAGISVVKAPLRASMAKIFVNIEGNSTVKNNLRYTARVYVSGVATNIFAYYDHVNDGQPRWNFSGVVPIVAGNDVDVRVTQSSGATITVSGTITVEFDVRQF